MLILYPGIVEFIGESGTGKTKLALGLNKDLITLYISIDSSGIPHLLPNVIPIKKRTFLELKIFLAKEIKRVVEVKRIKKIILDGFENYLYDEYQPRVHSDDIFRIIKIFKYLNYKKGIEIIVINSSNGKWENEGVKIINKYFGLPWEYMVNRRYLISRCSNIRDRDVAYDNVRDGVREVRACGLEERLVGRFIITDTGIEEVEKGE